MSTPANLKCPNCGRPTRFNEEPVGPFCSPRCKLADLGRWLAEDYRVSEPLRPEHFAEYERLEGGPELDRPPEE